MKRELLVQGSNQPKATPSPHGGRLEASPGDSTKGTGVKKKKKARADAAQSWKGTPDLDENDEDLVPLEPPSPDQCPEKSQDVTA
jgi:hypothetical protein